MSKIKEIEKEVQGLKPNELQAFRKWFWDFDAKAWDRQFEKDALTEKDEEGVFPDKYLNCIFQVKNISTSISGLTLFF